MPYSFSRPRTAGLLSCCAWLALAVPAFAADVPDARWGAFGAYYDSANGLTGNALKQQLRSIISNNRVISYDTLRQTLPLTDRVYGDTSSTPRMWTVYDRTNITGVWDAAKTWNREHVWPESRVGSNNDHDMFNIRPALTATNGGRGNNYFGGITLTGAPRLVSGTNSQFFPGDVDKGDVARACMYMATRYSSLTLNVSKVGVPSANNDMGDLEAMLHWHYLDLPDNFERRRNQMIYANTDNASGTVNAAYSQANRNPYIDHPEYVWSVYGDGANDSRITLDTVGVNGASTKDVTFGRVIVGGTAPTMTTGVAINKSGADPTTFSVTTAGLATADGTTGSVRTNVYNSFYYGTGTKTLTVGLNGVTTATAGLKSGTVTLDNTDLTTQGAGTGSGDGNDTVNLSLSVLDHSNASFDAATDTDTLVINFQDLDRGDTASANFSLYNLLSASGYTAGLDFDSITGNGDTDVFATGLSGFSALAAGSLANFTATFAPTRQGWFYATYTLGVSDENLSGATAGNALTLILSGVTSGRSIPEPTLVAIAPALAMLLRRRRAA